MENSNVRRIISIIAQEQADCNNFGCMQGFESAARTALSSLVMNDTGITSSDLRTARSSISGIGSSSGVFEVGTDIVLKREAAALQAALAEPEA